VGEAVQPVEAAAAAVGVAAAGPFANAALDDGAAAADGGSVVVALLLWQMLLGVPCASGTALANTALSRFATVSDLQCEPPALWSGGEADTDPGPATPVLLPAATQPAADPPKMPAAVA